MLMKQGILISTLGALLLGTAFSAQAVPTLTLTTPDLIGRAGNVVGWGFTLDGDATYELLVTSVYADGSLYGQDGQSALGEFADYVAIWSFGGAPWGEGLSIMANQSFTGSVLNTALAIFTIRPDAPESTVPVTGKIHLTYDLVDCTGDTGCSGELTAQYDGADAWASVTVPTPATAALVVLGLAGLRRRRRQVQS